MVTPAKVLVEFLVSTFNLDRQGRLIETVKAGPWQDADEDTRFTVLNLVDEAIIKARLQAGRTPVEDSLPFGIEPPTTFELIRDWLTPQC